MFRRPLPHSHTRPQPQSQRQASHTHADSDSDSDSDSIRSSFIEGNVHQLYSFDGIPVTASLQLHDNRPPVEPFVPDQVPSRHPIGGRNPTSWRVETEINQQLHVPTWEHRINLLRRCSKDSHVLFKVAEATRKGASRELSHSARGRAGKLLPLFGQMDDKGWIFRHVLECVQKVFIDGSEAEVSSVTSLTQVMVQTTGVGILRLIVIIPAAFMCWAVRIPQGERQKQAATAKLVWKWKQLVEGNVAPCDAPTAIREWNLFRALIWLLEHAGSHVIDYNELIIALHKDGIEVPLDAPTGDIKAFLLSVFRHNKQLDEAWCEANIPRPTQHDNGNDHTINANGNGDGNNGSNNVAVVHTPTSIDAGASYQMVPEATEPSELGLDGSIDVSGRYTRSSEQYEQFGVESVELESDSDEGEQAGMEQEEEVYSHSSTPLSFASTSDSNGAGGMPPPLDIFSGSESFNESDSDSSIATGIDMERSESHSPMASTASLSSLARKRGQYCLIPSIASNTNDESDNMISGSQSPSVFFLDPISLTPLFDAKSAEPVTKKAKFVPTSMAVAPMPMPMPMTMPMYSGMDTGEEAQMHLDVGAFATLDQYMRQDKPAPLCSPAPEYPIKPHWPQHSHLTPSPSPSSSPPPHPYASAYRDDHRLSDREMRVLS